jgi:hypothetical protein
MQHAPENLNLWDRLFNRYRRVLLDRGAVQRSSYRDDVKIPGSEFISQWVEYTVIDRLTGSETIEREYLN